MNVLHLVAPVVLSAMTVFGALTAAPGFPDSLLVEGGAVLDSTDSVQRADSLKNALPDTFTPPMLGASLRYGVDTTISPCVDFYQYVNGDWRAKTKLGKLAEGASKRVEFFADMDRRTRLRLQTLLDSASTVAATTIDPTLRVLGTFYRSCLTADSLERFPGALARSKTSKTPVKDSTRAEQCVQRTRQKLGGALGQAFAQDLVGTSQARPRMEALLEALRAAAIKLVQGNPWMTAAEKDVARDRLQKLKLRVGIPEQRVDYSSLALTNDYKENKNAIANFGTRRMVNAIGGNLREQWKAGLLIPNAFYMGWEHAIEIPAVMFMPPFFDANAEDALNFAGVGFIIGHEIFHSVAAQLWTLEHPQLQENIEKFKQLNSELGEVDGWGTNGKRTFSEDIADYGGLLVAYDAWKATLKKSKTSVAPLIDGYTPDQRFLLGVGRVWRAKWQAGGAYNADVHAAPFARVNGVMMNVPQFANAFGCKEGDPMVRPAEKRPVIW